MHIRSRFEPRQCSLGWMSLLTAILVFLPAHVARGDENKDQVGRLSAHVSLGGTNAYVPGRWGLLRINLSNPTSEPMEVLAASYFEDEPTLQYGRRVCIPAMSRLQTWHPILVPAKSSAGPQRFDFRTLFMDMAQQREVLIRSETGALQLDGMLRADEGKLVVGLIDHLGEPEAVDSSAPMDLILSSQSSVIRHGKVAYLADRLLPAGEECLQSLDQLVIADSRFIDDGAGLVAIRRWLFGGGRLWVMLDRVDPLVLERLLGDESLCQVIDRVGLTTVRLEVKAPNGSVAREIHEHEQPVEFVRVLASEVEVACRIDGWPAAFWKSCGEGRLLVTTLAPKGWMRERTSDDYVAGTRVGSKNLQPAGRNGSLPEVATATESEEPVWQSPFVSLGPMQEIASEFFRARSEPRLAQATLESLVQEYVGYSIPARWQVIGLLLGFSAVLGALGFWLWRRSRLEVLGFLSPAMALLVSIILVWLGWVQRQSIPAAVARVQFVRAVPETDDVRVEGVAGLFSPDAGIMTAGSKGGGWLMPDMTGLSGKTRRMVWTDFDEWQWEHLPKTAGLMNATLLQSATLPERIEAQATFGPEGLSGRLHAAAAHEPTDAILATRAGRIGVDLRDDGTFVARTNAVFTAEQFLAADLLSDEQHRRQRTLMQLLDDPQRRDYPEEPQLLFWSKPWDLGLQFERNRQSLGSALVAVPLKLERPPTGTDVSLAAPLLPYREVIGPDDIGLTGLWDYRRREWQQRSSSANTWLRFQIPRQLLPVAVRRGRLVIQVTGPVGRLELAGQRPNGNEIVSIQTWKDPVGTLTWELTDPDLLSVTTDGGLLLRISGGESKPLEQATSLPDSDSKVSYWQIESLALELHVRTTETN